jgi:hypothetical protein
MVKVWDKVETPLGKWNILDYSYYWILIVRLESWDIKRFLPSQIEVIKEPSYISYINSCYEDIYTELMYDWKMSENFYYLIQMQIMKDLKKQMGKQESKERKPKRWEIVEVTDYWRENSQDAQFICEIEEYDWYKYFANDWSWSPTVRKQMRQKPTEEPKQEDIIFVPDNIKIESFDWNLAINNWKQSLFYSEGIYKVAEQLSELEVKCKLIPIDVKDLEAGGTYYHTEKDDAIYSIGDIALYCKYLWGWKYAHWMDCWWIDVSSKKWNNWYKVVPID